VIAAKGQEMKIPITALTLVSLALAPASTLGASAGSGGALPPPEPTTGGATAPKHVKTPAPVTTDSSRRAETDSAARPETPQAPRAATAAEPSLGELPEPVTKAQQPRPDPPTRRDDRDVVVPVPEDLEAAATVPRPDAAKASEGLPRAGLEVIPLIAMGLATMIAGLAMLRLVSRRSA